MSDAALEERVSALSSGIDALRLQRTVLDRSISNCREEIESNRYQADLNQKSSEVIKQWLEDLLKSNVDSMAELVTSALKSVIEDQELKFLIRQEIKHNRLSMRFAIEENGVEAEPLSSFGGGAVLLSSFVLRLAVMTRLKMADLLLLDESLSAVANKYIPACSDFMRQLAEETGVNILMVTHNEDFMDRAHTAYDASTFKAADGLKAIRLRRRGKVG